MGLHAQNFSSFGEWGLLFVVVLRLLLSWSVGSRHAGCSFLAQERWLSSCDALVLLLHSMWILPRPGIELMFLALQGRFLATRPPGKSPD